MLSVLCTLLIGLLEHHYWNYCQFFTEYSPLANYIIKFSNFLLVKFSLNSIGYSLLYISTYEFICAQNPHSMKGFIIGMFFGIRGFFQSLGVLAIYMPINSSCYEDDSPLICGVIYYALTIVILLIGIITYVITARKYQYRERDEPDNTYRYAEEYYANAQDEPNYDYDDYDDLNVETINN